MNWQPLATYALAICCSALAAQTVAAETERESIRYLPLDAPAGMPQAVIVQGMPLVYTRQLLPLDREGKIVGDGSADRQIEQVLDNLAAVLNDSKSGMDKLVRVNVYALSTAIVEQLPRAPEQTARPGGPPGDYCGADAACRSQGAGGR